MVKYLINDLITTQWRSLYKMLIEDFAKMSADFKSYLDNR